MRTALLIALSLAAGCRDKSASSTERTGSGSGSAAPMGADAGSAVTADATSGSAADAGADASVAMGASKHVPEGTFFRCSDKHRTFELWDGGGFEFRYNQVGIEGSYELRGQTIVFMPSDTSKSWKDYTGLDSKELAANEDWTKAGPFDCSLN